MHIGNPKAVLAWIEHNQQHHLMHDGDAGLRIGATALDAPEAASYGVSQRLTVNARAAGPRLGGGGAFHARFADGQQVMRPRSPTGRTDAVPKTDPVVPQARETTSS